MKVDGGKSLTSRGQINWYGQVVMTRKFEQEYTSDLQRLFTRNAQKPKPVHGDRDGLEHWMDEIQISKWALKSDEAHLKQTAGYHPVLENANDITHLQT